MFASKKYVQGCLNNLVAVVTHMAEGQTRRFRLEIARLESRIAGFAGAENSASSKSTRDDFGTRVIWLSEVPLSASQVALVKIIRAYCGGTLLETRDLVLKAMQGPSNVDVVLDPYLAHSPKLDPSYVAAQLTELGCSARVVELK